MDNSGLKTVIVEPSTIQTLIENKSLVEADGGIIYIGVKQAEQLLDTAMNIKNSGTLQANSLNDLMGKVTLDGDNVEVSGSITAKDGEVRVGNKDNNKTVIKSTATLEADFVETSGKSLKVEDGVKIKAKEWLLDPTDITIESAGGTDVAGSSISGSTISSYLNSTGNLTLIADNNINVNDAVSWSANKLTLTAGNDINVNDVINITGNGNITLNYINRLRMKQGSDGLSFDGKINFAPTSTATTMLINGDTYNLVKSLSGWNSSIALQYGARAVLTSDLDAGQTALNAADLWQFDGLGHTISNLKYTANFVENNNQTSLFRGRSGQNGFQNMRLSNLGVLNLDTSIPTSNDSNGGVGGLVSSTTYNGDYNTASSLSLFNVFAQGSINSGVVRTGGLVGNFTGSKLTIDESHSMVDITSSKNYVGGMFASGVGALVKNSYVKADIIGEAYIGGIAGVATSADVQDSYVVGNITSNNVAGVAGGFFGQFGTWFLGNGLVGSSYNNVSDTLQNSYYAGTITGSTKIGGIIGDAWTYAATPSFTITLNNIKTYGEVLGTSTYLGGLVGQLGSGSTLSLTNSHAYNTTKQNITTASVDYGVASSFLGTLVGNTGTITNTNSSYSSTIVPIDITLTYNNFLENGSTFEPNKNNIAFVTLSYLNGDASVSFANGYTAAYYNPIIKLVDTSGDLNIDKAINWSDFKFVLDTTGDININAIMNGASTASLEMNTGAGKLIKTSFNDDGTFKGKVNLSGTGELKINADVYSRINSITELQAINDNVDNIGGDDYVTGNYYLGANIDANGVSFRPLGVKDFDDNNYSWNTNTPFAGNFQGFGHTISNLTINTGSAIKSTGLFGSIELPIGSSTFIGNIGLISANITGTENVGGLVGYIDTTESVTIANVYVQGSVTSTADTAGGLIGKMVAGKVMNSYADTTVAGAVGAGGFIGVVSGDDGVTISSSYSKGSVSGEDVVGGFLGKLTSWNDAASNLGPVWIENSYSQSTVVGNSGASAVGGFAGLVQAYAKIINSYSTGSVSGSGVLGGFAGQVVSMNTTDSPTYGDVNWNPILVNNFWDKITSGQTVGLNIGHYDDSIALSFVPNNGSTGTAEGKTSTEMKTLATFSGTTPAWDIDGDSSGAYPKLTMGGSKIWNIYSPIVNSTATIISPNVSFGGFNGLNQIQPSGFSAGTPVYGTDYDVVVKSGSTVVFDSSDNARNSLSILNGLNSGSYTISVVAKGSAFSVSGTDTMFNIAKKDITYSVSNDSKIYGQAVTLPTASFTGGTPRAMPIVKVYDSLNNDVTSQATAGTLEAGTYAIRVQINDDNYQIS